MSLSKPANFDQAQSVVPCDVCERESGEHYCTVCRQTLCDGCKKYHKKVAATKDHEVVSRVQMVSALASTACRRHPDQTVSLHCEPCQTLVCIKCVAGEHRGHPMVELSKIYQYEKAKVEKDILESEQQTIPSFTKAIEKIKHKREGYQRVIVDTRNKINDEINLLKAMLDKIHANRLTELSMAEAVGLAQFDLIQQGLEDQQRSHTDGIATCKAKIASNNQVQFVSYARTRGTKAHKCPVLKYSSPQIQVQTTEVDNKEIYELLVKLTMSTAPLCTISYKHIVDPKIGSTFKSKSKGWHSLCVTADGKAWIGGTDSKELSLVDCNGKVVRTRQTKNRPCALAMTSSGDIILSPHGDDSRTAVKLRADGTECPLLDVSPSYCYGVSVTEDDDILLCTTDGRVMRCNGDGGSIRQIYHGKKSDTARHAIELPDRNICISDEANNALVIIDKNGHIQKQIHKPLGMQDFSPDVLACDSLGNILSVDENNDCVCIISQKGDVRELVGKSHGIKEPRWLAVDGYDNMWVAQYDGNIKMVKYME